MATWQDSQLGSVILNFAIFLSRKQNMTQLFSKIYLNSVQFSLRHGPTTHNFLNVGIIFSVFYVISGAFVIWKSKMEDPQWRVFDIIFNVIDALCDVIISTGVSIWCFALYVSFEYYGIILSICIRWRKTHLPPSSLRLRLTNERKQDKKTRQKIIKIAEIKNPCEHCY